MDKIERIKKRIGGVLNTWKYGSSTEAKYRYEAYTELLEYIDALQEEPVGDELEDAATKYGKEQYGKKPNFLPDECRGCYAPIVRAFKAGAKWQARWAVEIAREETLQEVKSKLLYMLNTSIDNKHFFEQLDGYIEELENK